MGFGVVGSRESRQSVYPLMPVIDIPSINVFCVKKKRMMMGRATRVLAAMR
jgi:hypothetical protein